MWIYVLILTYILFRKLFLNKSLMATLNEIIVIFCRSYKNTYVHTCVVKYECEFIY